ncbi:ATP-dependent RNA helicase DHH1-like [Athalia rosae]|uniref:ATP-dependent RNA helicase DHH1-like n=1 Tax=Athalia rosae TaxID=37344 RepID=UPI002033E4C7|nr:ATP-dependent RNA helicase DHH1-like [Athalia rosae]
MATRERDVVESMNEEREEIEWPDDGELLDMTGLHLVDEGRPCPGDAQPVQEQAQPAQRPEAPPANEVAPPANEVAPPGEEAAPQAVGGAVPAPGAAEDNQKPPRGKRGGQWSQSRKREGLATRMIMNYVKLTHPYKGGQGHNKKGRRGGRGGQGGGGRGGGGQSEANAS